MDKCVTCNVEAKTIEINGKHLCLNCVGTEASYIANNKEKEHAEKRKKFYEENQNLAIYGTLPDCYRKLKMDSFPVSIIKDTMNYITGDTTFLLINGANGTGKTALLYLLRRAMLATYPIKIEKIVMLVKKLQAKMADPEAQLKFIEELSKDKKVLAIDDLGKEKCTEFILQDLFLIIDTRLEFGLKTIITTNLTLDELNDKYGAAIMDRIRSGDNINMGGKSRR